MNKTRLREKWSKYCNTDNLVDECMALLKYHGHRVSEHGTCTVLDKYFTNKEPLIQQFMTSANYAGDMRIIVAADFEREIDGNAVYHFCRNFPKAINARKLMGSCKDADGKTITDYLVTGFKSGDIKSITFATKDKQKIGAFTEFGTTIASANNISEFNDWMYEFQYITDHAFAEDKNYHGVKINQGMKTSRAFNKVCVHYGADKAKEYNKLFAQYADLVADGVRHLHFVMSLNPLDYLTMSFGPNWKSCHNIADGCYKGGCVSYMLDKVSFITFVVDNLNAPIHTIPKIYRQMFYYDDKFFIQSRLYPQGKDGAVDLYKKFRVIVQNEFVSILNLNENNWIHTSNSKSRGIVQAYSTNTGNHYPDASSREDCGVFYPAETQAESLVHNPINIGHQSICFYCGADDHMDSGKLSHSSCRVPTDATIEEPDDDDEDEIDDDFNWD